MAGWTCAGCTTTYAVGAPRCPHCGSTERTDGRGGAVLPSLTVECGNGGCAHVGKRRRVHLRTAAPGVLEMPRLACAGCGLDMPTVTPWPPVTESEDETMPKITVHGGPSHAAEEPPAEPVEETPEEGEQPSPGNSSETSTEKPPTSPEPSKPTPRKRARGTASRSTRGQTAEDSTAPSTATDGPRTDGADDAGS